MVYEQSRSGSLNSNRTGLHLSTSLVMGIVAAVVYQAATGDYSNEDLRSHSKPSDSEENN